MDKLSSKNYLADGQTDSATDVSIILPIHNEAENINLLYQETKDVLNALGESYEIICVEDGSQDSSLEILKKLSSFDTSLKVIVFKHNFGQTAALSAGISAAQGAVIIPMDADGQNDPRDIPHFLEKIAAGASVVSGWRKHRRDKLFSRVIPSKIANWLIGFITGVKIHDYGCTMKAYRREIIQGVSLYGEMHRFIAAYAAWHGGRVEEIVVNHRPRGSGQTHYGISRTFKVLLDLVVIIFLSKYINRPMHFFGGIGFISFFLGLAAGTASVALKLFHIRDLVATPLPTFSALLLIVGIQLIVLGIIAEMIMRVYYEAQDKKPYQIKAKINF
ncbi:glycosyltransferase [Candidatus Falkowbacteria bacterium CG10_big_fil_rev_8_21_14_0_10_44_15]|uniref:Glycosyltransferase n=1 Tax=Candidatus Falkowbacteria bacterium CG10_big_fil_rev_8_21_14_0_10_44_15 TaxID=1974569 RepID=A0A2H0V080_9BACT|nr:MAG: glycosyltransferase [Candidatus Falkowbacteria bacterium CG10_big_fil_rev_8_21_14_0_10_44_15]